MSKNPILPLCFLFLLVLLSACFSKVTISVLEPGTYTVPASVQKITIYSRPGMQVTPGLFDSLTDIRFDRDIDINKMRQGYLDGVYEIMSVSPRFKKAVLSDTVFDKLLVYGNLSWKSVDSICSHDTSDALLYLWKAVSYAGIEYSSAYTWQPGYTDLSGILNRTMWMLFGPVTHLQLGSYTYTDTVSVVSELLLDEEDIDELLYENCYVMGRAFGEKMCPHWQDMERMMYVGPGRDLRKAVAFTADEKWVDAGAIWDRLAESPKEKLAYRAAFNLALAYERDDVLDQAVLWIAYADSLHSTAASSSYKKILEKRLKLKPLLDEQMAGN